MHWQGFMFSRIRRSIGRFFNKSRKINHEPINKVSLIVIIIVDLFILFNVFVGLDDVSRWPMSPQIAYPCQYSWQEYRNSSISDKDYNRINEVLSVTNEPWQQSYLDAAEGQLGSVSNICLQYEQVEEAVDPPANRDIAQAINNVQAEINSFKDKNSTIRQQYDSTLLEEIAGQPREQSINNVEAAQARAEIEQNDRAIAQRETTLATLKTDLLNTAESQSYLAFLNNDSQFAEVDSGYSRASFWYPSIQLLFQALFLLPLIFLASTIHQFAQRKGYGYVSLISWHLLVIFLIPLIWKVFEFLQIGFLFEWIADVIEVLFGGLQFLWNYVQILLIPIIGFGIIKFLQKVVFNTRIQAANRVQKMRCVSCAKKIRKYDVYCPHCSYPQYQECPSCHNLTYKHLPHCKHCGENQLLDL